MAWQYRGLRTALNNLPPSALEGSIQYRNASAAIAAIESLDGAYTLNEQTVSQALRHCQAGGAVPGSWRGRLNGYSISRTTSRLRACSRSTCASSEGLRVIMPVRVRVVDALRRNLAGRAFAGRTFAVVGIRADKDAREIAAAREPLVDHWILCSLPGARGSSASDLAQRLLRRPTR